MKNKKQVPLLYMMLCIQCALMPASLWGKSDGDAPLFAENKGQLKDQHQKQRNDILYYGNSGGMAYYFQKSGMSYQLYKKDQGDKVSVSRVDIKWIGTSNSTEIVAGAKSRFTENFYDNGVAGVTGVQHFEDLRYKALYKGIDLHYYYKGGLLKYDFEVSAGADYKQIRIKLAGASAIGLNDDGSISIATPNGTIKEGKPVAYQAGREVSSIWVLKDNILSFELPAYDPKLPVTIDPLVFQWEGSYYTSLVSGSRRGKDVAFDDYGSFYVVGYSYSNFGPSGTELKKFNGTGGLQWSVSPQIGYWDVPGGAGLEINSITVKNTGIYLGGQGAKVTGVATSGAYQNVINGGMDCVLAKYDTSGTKLWATFYGGAASDSITGCKADELGNVYICGLTRSPGTMASAGAYQPAFGGVADAFIAKFDANGMRVWGTYYGGNDYDAGIGLALKGNRIFVAGRTKSTNNIALAGFQPALTGTENAFLLCMDTSGTAQWCTYYGAGATQGKNCVVGNSAVYLAGSTDAATNIATTGAHLSASAGGGDGFLAKFDMNGNRLWGTYFGGAGQEVVSAVTKGNDDNIYIAGKTFSNSGIGTSMSYTPVYNPYYPSSGAGYIVEFDTSGQHVFGTYFNTESDAQCCAASNLGEVLVAGIRPTNYGFMQKFAFCNVPKPVISASAINICSNIPTVLSVPPVTGATYKWYRDGVSIPGATGNTYSTATAGTYKVVRDNCQSGESDQVMLTVVPAPVVQTAHTDIPCYGAPVGTITVVATGGTPPYAYNWQGLPDTTASLSGLNIGTYVVHTTDSNGCGETDTVIVLQNTTIAPSNPLASICAVTVDSASGQNLVVWEKIGIVKAVNYNIYRESSTSGQYDLIGTVSVNDPGIFLDNTAIPLQQSYSYKIAETDSCANEWPLSGYHKTIHLSANTGTNGELNLSWNAYEGITYNTHYIERSTDGGDYVLLNQVSATTLAYSDLTPPPGVNRYRLYIDIPAPCTAAAGMAFQRVASNIIVLNPTGISDPSLSGNVHIAPNPTNGIIHILGSNPARISVYDLSGKLLRNEKNVVKLDIGGYAAGTYLICLFDKNGNMYYKQKVILK